jgi:hypothetical protein
MESKEKNIFAKSTMFKLSLGGKELFHSNFLAWLTEKNWDSALNLLKDMAGEKFSSCEGLEEKGWRERKSFDFSIWSKKGNKSVPLVVVENKVKSIAYRNQLDRYAKDVENMYGKTWEESKDNVRMILLSLAKVMPDVPVENNIYKSPNGLTWHIVDYGTYSNIIRKYFLEEDAVNNEYDKDIIKDYCNYISALNTLAKQWLDQPHLKADEEMEELRFDDIRQKIIYSYLLNKLNEKLNNGWCVLPISSDDFKHLVYDKPEGNSKWDNKSSVIDILNDLHDLHGDNDKKPLIMMNLDYGRAGALVQMKFKLKDLKNDLICVIQVQNQSYSIGVEFGKETIDDIQKKSGEYNFVPKGLYPTTRGDVKFIKGDGGLEFAVDNKKDTPLHYKPSFFYAKAKFDSNAGIDNVVSQLISDLNRYKDKSGNNNIVPLKAYLEKWDVNNYDIKGKELKK